LSTPPGSHYEQRNGDFVVGDGQNLEIDPPRRLVQSGMIASNKEQPR